MIVAIHQPNYLPWLGYFAKMALCDVFVFLDDAQFTRGGYINRTRVLGPNGPAWLTIPAKPSLGTPILAIRVASDAWKQQHLQRLSQWYRTRPGYELWMAWLAEIMPSADGNMAESNMALITAVAEKLGVSTPTERASQLGVRGRADERLARITRCLGGDTYLSGPGGANYQDPVTFSALQIRLQYSPFRPFPYPQALDRFEPGLSAVDFLFQLGRDAKARFGAAMSDLRTRLAHS